MAVAEGIPGVAVIDEGEELEDASRGGGGGEMSLHSNYVLQGSAGEQLGVPAHSHSPAASTSGGKTALFGQGG